MYNVDYDKIFCIGLHKTGTSSLYDFAQKLGFSCIHSANWHKDKARLEKFDFFSDGGSHYDGINEFDYIDLLDDHPAAKFILQTRDTRGWIVSKLKHAGWSKDTVIQVDDPSKLNNEHWKYKSLLHVKTFIKHKVNYERKVKDYFGSVCPDQLLTIDITSDKTRKVDILRLGAFLDVPESDIPDFPHSNKARAKSSLSDEVMSFIDEIIADS